MPGTNQRYVLPDWIENLSFEHALKLLLFGAFGQNAPAGTGVPVSPGGGSGIDNVNLKQVNGSTIALGSAAAAASLPVTVATDQAAFPTKDAGPSWTTSLGVGGARVTSADQSGAVASITDAPTSGQKIVVTDILFSSDTALRLDFSCETTGTIVASVYCAAGSSGQFTPRGKLKLATADKKLQWRASVAGNIAVTPLYYSEA